MQNVNSINTDNMEHSVYNDPLYKALKSARVDERLAVDAVINRSVFNSNLATKEDLKLFATKEDLKLFATKEDLKLFATKEDLKLFATKEDLKLLATKEDLKLFATKEDLSALREEMHTNTIKLMKWMTTLVIGSSLGLVTVMVALLALFTSI